MSSQIRHTHCHFSLWGGLFSMFLNKIMKSRNLEAKIHLETKCHLYSFKIYFNIKKKEHNPNTHCPNCLIKFL